MGVIEIKSLAELDNACSQGKAVIIDFFAVWCGPCKMIGPKFEAFSERYPNILAVRVDVDNAEDIAGKYEISAMPTFIVLKNGQKVDSLVGASPDKLEALFKKYN